MIKLIRLLSPSNKGAIEESIPRKSFSSSKIEFISDQHSFKLFNHSSTDLHPLDKSVGCNPIAKPSFSKTAEEKYGLETYIIKGEKNSGIICMNGASAHLIKKGEEIIIMGFELSDEPVTPKSILVDRENKFVRYL